MSGLTIIAEEAMLQVYYGSNTLNFLGNHVINNLIHAHSFLNTTPNSSHNDKMEKIIEGTDILTLNCNLFAIYTSQQMLKLKQIAINE